MQIGAQLYTLRTFCQNEKDFGRTLARVRGMGYTCVQLSALGPMEPKRIKAICDDNGLKIVLTHNPEADFLHHTGELIEKHLLYGCKYIGLGSMPERYRNVDFLPYFAEDFAPAAEKIHNAGMRMMYHNHAFEFERMPDGKTMMDHLLAGIPAEWMGVTADTYWLHYAGIDVCQWLAEHAERIPCVHLKDYAIHGFDIRMAAVGQGNLDFARILDLLQRNGVTEYALVEQDDCYGASPFDCMQKSFEYIQKINAMG